MSLKSMGLGFLFTARDFASAKMLSVEKNFSRLDNTVTGGAARMDSAFKQIGVGLGLLTAGAVAFGGGLVLAGAAGKFEQGLAAVGAVTRATTTELDMLSKAAVNAGIQTQFSPEEAVEGLTSLATAGQTATQSTQTLIPVLDLAAGSLGQLGVAQAAEAVVGTLNAYGMAADEAVQVTDRLLRITQLTNFQTRDFEAGLSKAAAAGATFGQELNDVLITMGLLRNRNIDASSSATAFREATRRLGADTRAQQAIMKAGVALFDEQTGKMRSIVDITSDFAKATESMTDKERQRLVTVAYGARGLLAFNAIQKAAFTTMRDGTQVTLEGAEAVATMRKEMQAAGGTAEGFRDKLLDTFEGQKTLLKGTMQTFAVALGEPFAAVFKPVVQGIVNTLNTLLRMFKALPKPIKEAFAGFVTAAGAVVMVVGAVIALKGAFKLAGVAAKAVGLSFGGLTVKMIPLLLIIAAVSAAIAAFRWAYQKNLGGIADFVDRIQAKVTLFWDGLKQLFSQGGFSGAVKDELAKAENRGLKGFLIDTYRFVHKLKSAWGEFQAGFTGAVEGMTPVFEDLKAAITDCIDEIAQVFSDLTGQGLDLPFDSIGGFARSLGAALVYPIKLVMQLIAVFARMSRGIIRGFRAMMAHTAPALDAIGYAIDRVRANWNLLFGTTEEATNGMTSSTETWTGIGDIIGMALGAVATIIGGVIAAIIELVSAIIWVGRGFKAVGTWIGESVAKVVLFFTEDIPNALSVAGNRISNFFRGVRAFFIGVGAWFKDVFDEIVSSITHFFSPVIDFFTQIERGIKKVIDTIVGSLRWVASNVPSFLVPDSLLQGAAVAETKSTNVVHRMETSPSTATVMAMPAVSESRSRTANGLNADDIVDAIAKQGTGRREPMTFNLQVDGETIARAAHNADEEAAGRSFAPLPMY